MMTRGEFIGGLFGTALALRSGRVHAAPSPVADRQVVKRPAIEASVIVPVDHERPDEGTFALQYLLRRRFDPELPTVFVIGDGQQFFIRKDLAFDWAETFGAGVNVVGIPGRGFNESIQARLSKPSRTASSSGTDWVEAFRLLRYEQWTDDIDAVRASLLGPNARVMIWGGSGGGFLAHQYLSRHGAHASRVFTEAALNPFLDARFGFESDRFWEELSPADRDTLARVLSRDTNRRDLYVQLFQRQNFFVEPDQIAAARHQLISDLDSRREEIIGRLRGEYQVDDINKLEAGPLGLAIRVRLYEFHAPVAAQKADVVTFRPDRENSEQVARPLMSLRDKGVLPMPAMNFRALHTLDTEVTLLAGFRDHTVDYRSQVSLASHYPNSRLILVDDNHEFDRLSTIPGAHAALVQGAFRGADDPAFNGAVNRISSILWKES